jgi:hypothetical protein
MRSRSAVCEKYHKGRQVQLEHPHAPLGSQPPLIEPTGWALWLEREGTDESRHESRHPLTPHAPWARVPAIMLRAAHHHHVHHHGPTGLGKLACVARSC